VVSAKFGVSQQIIMPPSGSFDLIPSFGNWLNPYQKGQINITYLIMTLGYGQI
jgi:hypothetical protein